jgi:hypothetical protein
LALAKKRIGKPEKRTRTDVLLQLRSAFTADYFINSPKKASSGGSAAIEIMATPLRSDGRFFYLYKAPPRKNCAD